ncbi:hypothetical protein [Homoserinimonas hongtaonis]|uniref:Glutaminase n=1 Tax=Homoserinimonas hongtaonis TaxID=2079791 RepID=A0A2U1T1P4_9MICO|nr:hypothetical protein [Salinibacterium hongtaonis]PWB97794.1 hypothetical protein DF220_08095 [Salinibacterium hongtaonis]
MDAAAADATIAAMRDAIAATTKRLADAAVADESLAEMVTPRRILFVQREPLLREIARVWHLGVLLLARDGTLYEAGVSTRAVEPGRPNYQSASGEERRAHRAAAVRGGFAPGHTVNFDARPVSLDLEALTDAAGRVYVHDGRALVRWTAGATPATSIDFARYLDERASLLIDPPAGA